MKAIILDIPTTPIFTTPEFTKISGELKKYRLYDQRIKLEEKFKIKFPLPNSYNRGLLFIAAILENEGIEVEYYNSNYNKNFWDKCKDRIENTDLLLTSAKTNNYPIVLDILEKAKKTNSEVQTIIGGSHPTTLPAECLRTEGVDYVVMGEGEKTMEELCKFFIGKKNKKLEDILGLAFKKGGRIYINKPRPLISDLDSLPMPAYHLLPGGLKSYHPYIDTSRGCPYECGFCSGPNFWRRKLRTRSFESFYEELLLIKSLMGEYNFLHISDPVLGATEEQIEILKELKNKKHNLWFSCDIKANCVKESLIKTMMDCDIRVFSIGIETLNDNSLRLIKKNCSAKLEIEACRLIKKFAGSFIKSYWIIGLPGEDKKSLQYNNKRIYNLLKSGVVDQICNHILVPYPGTEFFNNPKKFGINILHKKWIHYEGRSYPPVYNLDNLSSKDIYSYFLQALNSELSYYKEKYSGLPGIHKGRPSRAQKKEMSFAEHKGRLI